MASAPSRYEVEHLHRLMMQASVESAQLDRRLQDEQKTDGLTSELKNWHDSADALQGAVERARATLIADGTPKEQVDRIRDRLSEIKSRARNFDVQNDLDGCVSHWQALGLELGQLSGKYRDTLVGLLQSRKGRVDQTTTVLSQARQSDGMLPEKHRKVLRLTDDRDRAREKYERLRQKYIEAERDCQLAEQQKAKEKAAAQEHKTGAAPLPNLAGLAKKGPVLVRLPDPKAVEKKPASPEAKRTADAKKPVVPQSHAVALPKHLDKPELQKSLEKKVEQKKLELKKEELKKQALLKKPEIKKPEPKHLEAKKVADPKHPEAKHFEAKKDHPGQPGARKVEPPKTPEEKKKLDLKKAEEKKAEEKKAAEKKKLEEEKKKKEAAQKKLELQKQKPATRPAATLAPRKSLSEAQHAALHGPAKANLVSGPPTISVERVEKVAGYPTAMDGIGRGGQTASIYFRANHLGESLQIQGSSSIQLGCSVRLDVLPSVQIFSASAGAPVRGKLSLGLISSGGRLGTVPPKNAHDSAKQAATQAAANVASRLGFLGKQLQSAIQDVLADAADKIFGRAQVKAAPNKLPNRPAGPQGKGPSVEFQVARFNNALGSIIVEARQVKGGQQQKQKLGALLDRDHQHRDSVAGRLEQTLSHLATATHRTLTDASAGELRNNLARMDSILARLKGKAGQEVAEGAQEISGLLQRMGSIASSKGGAPHIESFRKLIEERKGQLKKIVGDSGKSAAVKAPKLPAHHAQQHSVVKQLSELRKHNPGLDKLLRHASQSQLASELAKIQKSALHKLPAGGKKGGHGGLGSFSLAGAFQSLGGSHLGGFGGGHRGGGLSGLSGVGGALTKALQKQLEGQIRGAKPGDVGKILAGFHKSPKGSPLHDLAKKADEKSKRLATKRSHRGPMPSHITAEALLQVFKEHPKGQGFAQHLAPGGALRGLCESAQRGHGLPLGQTAQHYLASRGSSKMWNAVSTFNSLVKEGHKPHFWSLSSIAHAVADTASSAFSKVTSTVSNVASKASSLASSVAGSVKSGVSSLGGGLMNFGKQAFSSVKSVASRAVGGVKSYVSKKIDQAKSLGHNLYDKASGLAHSAYNTASGFAKKAVSMGSNALHSAGSFISQKAHGLYDAGKGLASKAWGGIKSVGSSIGGIAKSGMQRLQGAAHWAQGKVGDVWNKAQHLAGGAVDWAKHKAQMVGQFAKDKIHAGLDVVKTGVAGGLKGLKTGLSYVKKGMEYTPLGLAYKAAMKTGEWVKKGGLQKAWSATKNVAGKAWGGLKTAYNATSKFLQSPAGQLLVTGVSLAASFIPGGMVVKAIIGGGIGAITAMSEGKDWKGVLASAAGGALTGALPFMKMGPLAKIGMGALSGGISTLASGGSFKDALKGAAGGALDSVDPGAFSALKKMKGFATAEKLLSGKNLGKAEKAFLAESKFAGPLRGLEKAMANPKLRKSMGGLEKVTGKAVKGGIWVSGKAAKVQGVLDKVVGAGDKIHGVLSEVHDLAPGLSNMLGDNPAGNFVGKLGDWAGKGDEKLSKALEYGHAADDKLHQGTALLNKGLHAAGVKNPKKAYEKMQARKDLKAGKKGSLEHVAKLKLEDHQKKHPELHLAEATGKRTRGAHDEAKSPRKRTAAGKDSDKHAASAHETRTPAKKSKKASPHDAAAHGADHEKATKKPAKKTSGKPKSKLEQALAKGRGLIKKGEKVAQGVHDGLGKVNSVVAKGLAGAQQVQSGLEKASQLAKLGAGILGDDSELGKYLLDVSDKADKVHGYLADGIAVADEFNKSVGKVHDGMEHIPGVHAEGKEHAAKGKKKTPLEEATHLDGKGKKGPKDAHAKGPHAPGATEAGKKSPHDKPTHGPVLKPHAAETDAQKTERYKRAWDKLSVVSSAVQSFESQYAKTQRKIAELLAKGQGNAASIELMGLGSQCDSINKSIAEAKTLAKGHDKYEKEAKFYEEWHATTKAKLMKAIADTKGLGGQVAISGFGISETTHPDIFENTKNIYAVRTKVESFGEALHDHDAAEHVKAVLAEAKAARAQLTALKSKYKKDKAASKFLEGGTQDKLIDEPLKKLQDALAGKAPAGKKPDLGKHDPGKKTDEKKKPQDVMKSVEHGLKAIEKYKKKAIKSGKKIDAGLTRIEGMLGKGIKTGKKVDSGLGKIAGMADQVGKFLGEDSPVGHFAEQVSHAAQGGHDKLHDALGMASKGKSFVQKGHSLVHNALEAAQGHHQQKLEKVHGKKPAGAEHQHGNISPGELVKHAAHGKKSPHAAGDGVSHVMADGKQIAHDVKHAEKDAKKAAKDMQQIYKGGKKIVHGVQHAYGDAKHLWKDGKQAWGDVKHAAGDLKHAGSDVKGLWGDITSGNFKKALSDGKGVVGDVKGLVKDGKGLVGEGKKLFGEGKHLFDEGKGLFNQGKKLLGEGKGLVGDVKGLVGDAKGLFSGVSGLFGDVKGLFGGGKGSTAQPQGGGHKGGSRHGSSAPTGGTSGATTPVHGAPHGGGTHGNAGGTVPGGAPTRNGQGPSGGQHGRTAGNSGAPAGGDAHGLLATGSQGPSVTDLQDRLNAAGFKAGAADGIFGPNTRAAVIAFQKARKLKKVDGIVGPETWGALLGGAKPSPHDPPAPGKKPKKPTPAPGKKPAPHGPTQHAGTEAEAAQIVQGALAAVTAFGTAVTKAVKEIGALMQSGKTKDAGDKVQALSLLSEHTRAEVTKAVAATAKFSKLVKQAQAASKHYLEIRGHFFDFVSGLHGLAGQAQQMAAADAKKYPDLAKLQGDIQSLLVKLGALGDAKSADSAMKKMVDALTKEAKDLRTRVSKAQSQHGKDAKAAAIVKDLDAKLKAIEKQIAAHGDKAAAQKGDKDLGVGGGKKPSKPGPAPTPKKKSDPVDDILGGILGDDNRIHVDRGGARGDSDVHDGQDVDPAAMDTWIGSGEGVKLFSEVFGAFIPAEGAMVVVQHSGGSGGKTHGGASAHGGTGLGGNTGIAGGLHVPGAAGGNTGIAGGLNLPQLPGGLHLPNLPGGLKLPQLPGGLKLPGGLHLPNIPGMPGGKGKKGKGGGAGGILGTIGKMLPKSVTGFFKGLFDHLHGFADKIAGVAKLGEGILGKGMHFAEMGMHGLKTIEGASKKVQGIAGKAEGFLDKMGLHKLAGFAGKIGGAAGWVDKEAGVLHGGLKTADKMMGQGKSIAGQVEGAAGKAGGILDQAAHGKFGALVNLFKASKNGDGMDGRLVPEKISIGSQLDEPRRLDMGTLSKMETFLGGSFSGVRIHTGQGAEQVTSRFNAEAVTVKDHIFFAPGRFNPTTVEGQRLLAHELTHVLQKGRPNLDVRTAESEALHSEHSFGTSPDMTTLNLSQPQADFKLADGMGLGNASGVHTAKRNRSKGHVSGSKDTLPDGEEFMEKISDRVYEMLMEELEQSFESR